LPQAEETISTISSIGEKRWQRMLTENKFTVLSCSIEE
jgi:hypothetical protein